MIQWRKSCLKINFLADCFNVGGLSVFVLPLLLLLFKKDIEVVTGVVPL